MRINLPAIEDKTLPGLAKLLGRWRDYLHRWLALPALNERGKLLSITVTTTATAFEHGLGVAPSGWMILRAEGSAAASVVETASDTTTLTLIASAEVDLTLWVWPS